ncbi:MAG: lytic murein transglycosylase B [Gammaproteobacteria bacterium]
MIKLVFALAFTVAVAGILNVQAEIHNEPDVRLFVDEMAQKHGFDRDYLASILGQARISSTILEAISRPAEAMPWYKYRPIFLRNDRISLGADFIRQHRKTLDRAEQAYGVPPEIIAAIIGVETRYGQNTGSYKVVDALVTLGFRFPRRAEFFRSELEQFLLLTREQEVDPMTITGSYAGAMGIPQFISSSYRHYAVDFDNDGRIDIWNNPVDAIGSVANYFKVHGWEGGEKITVKAHASGDHYKELVATGLELDTPKNRLADYGITADVNYSSEEKVKLLSYETENGEELWIGFKNFYVITRYNRSILYAMAVYQLADEIAREYESRVAVND